MIPESMTPLARQWRVLVVGLLATAVLMLIGFLRVQVTYSAQATVLLIPAEASVPAGGNPFLYLGGLGQARDVVVRNLNTQASRKAILAPFGRSDFTASGDPTSSAPMIAVFATGPTASDATNTRKAVLEALPDQVTALQERASTPESVWFKTFVVADDLPPQADTKARLRALLAIAVVGTGSTVLAAALLDAALRRRRSGRGTDYGSAAPRDDSDTPAGPHQARESTDEAPLESEEAPFEHLKGDPVTPGGRVGGA